MSNLAEHFDQEHFADHDDSVEHTQYDVTVAGIEVEQSLQDYDTTAEIVATLEGICDSIEATTQLTKMDRVFIGHSFAAVERRVGLVIRQPSMESDDDGRHISMEGLGEALGKAWDGMVALIKRILKGIADFFRKLFGFSKDKGPKIKMQADAAKKAGVDASLEKLAANNPLQAALDLHKGAIEDLANKLADMPNLSKAKAADLVVLTPAAAAVVVHNSTKEPECSKPFQLNGETVCVMEKKALKEVEYLRIGTVNLTIPAFMFANRRMSFVKLGSNQVMLRHEDVTEMVWDTAFRGKEARTAGKRIAAELMDMALEAEKVFKQLNTTTPSNIRMSLGERTAQSRLAIQKLFASFEADRGRIPMSGRVVTLGSPSTLKVAEFIPMEVAQEDTGKEILIKFPKYGEVSKAADGIVTVTLLGNFHGSLDAVLKELDKAMVVWERIKGMISGNKQIAADVQALLPACMERLYNEPVKWLASYLRGCGTMEGTIISWGEQITNPLSKLAGTKDIVKRME